MSTPWDQAYDAGSAEHGPLPYPREAFLAGARERLVRRLARQGQGAGEVSLRALLARSAANDLYLALACEAGVPGATEALSRRYTAQVAELGRGLGLDEAAATQAARELLDDVARPPGRGASRTPLGAFDGSGSLRAWLAALLVRRLADAGSAPPQASSTVPGTLAAAEAEGLLEANLLAGQAEGRLTPPERARVRAAAAVHPEAAAALDALRRAGVRPAPGTVDADADGEGAPADGAGRTGRATAASGPLAQAKRPPPPRRRGRSRLAVAAALLGGLTALGALLAQRGVFDFEARRQDTERDVYAALRDLVRRDPGFFGGFQPLSHHDLEGGETLVERSGFTALWPRERVLSTTPRLSWTAVAGATRYEVSLFGEDGGARWIERTADTSLAWPQGAEPLPRETSWTWVVRPEGPQPGEARATFEVAPEQDLVRWNRIVERVGRLVDDPGARAVLLCQLALERGHVAEAYELIRRHTERWPKDGYARATRAYIERRWGLAGT